MKTLVHSRIALFVCLMVPVTVPQLLADTVQSAASVGFCAFEGTAYFSCPVGSYDSQSSLLLPAQTSFSGPLSGSGEAVNVMGSTPL
jgi:hypothetical protein